MDKQMNLGPTITEQTKELLENQNVFPIIYLDNIMVAPDQYTSMSKPLFENLDNTISQLIDYAISCGILNKSHLNKIESLKSAEGYILLKVGLDKEHLEDMGKKITTIGIQDQIEEHLRVLRKLLKKLPKGVSDDYIQQLIKVYNNQTL